PASRPLSLHDALPISPAVFFAVPRIWEKFYSGVAVRMREATRVGRLAYRWAIGIGTRMAEARIAGRRPSAGLWALSRLANLLVRSEEHTSELQSRGHL